MEIKFFNSLPESELKKIALLHFNQWSPMNSSLTLDHKVYEFTTEYAKYADRLPCGFAVYDNSELVGFCRLKSLNLNKYPDLTPWVSSLLVLSQGKGYGKTIVDYACETLKNLGYKEVYVYTDQAPEFYKKLNFIYQGMVDKNDSGQAELYSKTLS